MVDQYHDEHTSTHLDIHPGHPGGWFRFIPLFLFVLILYLIGKSVIADPRAQLAWGAYHLSWVEVLLLVSAVVALVEQMKVSHPGIDNTMEALGMIGMGVVQLILFVLGTAKVGVFSIFNNTEFLVLTFISLAAAVVAVMINARTLRRTIGVGDN
ncbi:MAG: hypothetical protein KGJ49_04065 [Alphaproteobacteria bacterium]|nr:hypothetical protein [Alphaproteobacteria bacterium]